MRTRNKVALGCGIIGLAAIVGAIVLVVVVFGAGVIVFGWPYSDTPRQRAWLQDICNPVKDVPLVIEAHFAKHGAFPKEDRRPGSELARRERRRQSRLFKCLRLRFRWGALLDL